MTYKNAALISVTVSICFALYSIITSVFFPHLWLPTTTRFDSWFDRSWFFTLGVFYATWSAKHDPR
jgi:hypothetical protein